MSRKARIKCITGIYHIISRSMSEILLFRDDADKDKYLQLIKKYQRLFHFKIYAFCLMDTHCHMIVNCCGADISKFMHVINQCYAQYYNKKYNRHGHVFADRFKSIPILDNSQLFVASAYVHNNPKDIIGYANNVEDYKFSSLRIYLNIINDSYNILDPFYILELFSPNGDTAIKRYIEFVKQRNGQFVSDDLSFNKINYDYDSKKIVLIRDFSPDYVVNFVKEYTGLPVYIHVKFNHKNCKIRDICVVLMRSLCNFNHKQICDTLGNISISTVSKICDRGLHYIYTEYPNIIDDFIAKNA